MSDRDRAGGGKDSPREMERMNAWLDQACAALAVDRAEVAAVTPDMLRLIGEVAHGPSRPAAPLTAFALGVAAGRGADLPAGVAAGAVALRALLAERNWTDDAPS
ncbi:MAG: molybdopterin-guanine dinucleotide biosynthesis protein [Austwickia sp.]|jgi:uncharacterized membrane protein (DUF4010 family)|nr:MAG: molybdopterin-guanine dinucleotide biosynthesis protein [Austwickia sp.]